MIQDLMSQERHLEPILTHCWGDGLYNTQGGEAATVLAEYKEEVRKHREVRILERITWEERNTLQHSLEDPTSTILHQSNTENFGGCVS